MNAHWEVKVSSWNPSEAGRSGVRQEEAGVQLVPSLSCHLWSISVFLLYHQAEAQWFPFTEPGQWSSRRSCQGRRDRRGICGERPLGPLGPATNPGDFPVLRHSVYPARSQRLNQRWVRGRRSQCFIGKGETCLYAPPPTINLSETRLTFRKNLADIDWWQALNDQRILMKFLYVPHSVIVQNIWPYI